MEFDTFELTANNYPVLQNNENIVIRQNNVSVLTAKQKYQRGIIYLTNLRLLWLKSNSGNTVTIAINLENIVSKQISTNLLSASTIKLEVRQSKKKENNNNINNEVKSDVVTSSWECQICNQTNSGRDIVCVLCGVPKIEDKGQEVVDNKPKKKASSKSRLEKKVEKVVRIECPACTYINEGEVEFCKICMTRLEGQKPLPEVKPIVCSICLFSNEPTATICSICSMPLKYCASTFDSESNNNNNNNSNSIFDVTKPVHYPSIIDSKPPLPISVPDGYDVRNPYNIVSLDDISYSNSNSISNVANSSPSIDDYDSDSSASTSRSSQTSSSYNLKEITYRVKLLFKSGQGQFYNELCKTIQEEHWKITPTEVKVPKTQRVGVAGVIRNIQENQKNTSEIMNQAFRDLDNLMKKASEMVAIAESISQKIIRDNNMEGSKEQYQLKEILQELGISNPVTRKSTGGVYYQELAKQVSKFIIKLFEKHGHVMTLPDIYCLYNRARGVEDLYKACSMFEKLQIPLKLRKFSSGLIIVEDDILLYIYIYYYYYYYYYFILL
ncbi:hypothetical protein BCR32DRAFT_4904 [Anaeromyces robustus]|uniref:Vacuolar protein-sorting-associated protein 36 n=1 Tax=Anaeromyces robustus TaxID=1754192 RepID=A0A1Y1X8C0_9FUNG|nr:hypothetical protein BCR32DRAFT_4904 [Anaeromyces robustus]|eukprot:ORX82011.1 hypothetical protein BCR32DRAFT_4904 [Anaeromyces robustus]